MELGVAPIISSGMIMQLLAGARMIHVNQFLREDRELFQTAWKCLGLMITLVQAIACLMSGMYGPV